MEAGEAMIPAKLTSEKARRFAALNLVFADLEFAFNCLKSAHALGMPDQDNLQATALIFAGVISYGRCFKGGVREEKLDAKDLATKVSSFDLEIHDYLIALRDKHVAHSVNDFEECQAVATFVGKPGAALRDGGAVGVIMKRSVGITVALLERAVAHVERMKAYIDGEVDRVRLEVYAEFKEANARGEKWEMAPIYHASNRADIAKRRG
jgi:hypothetical protein